MRMSGRWFKQIVIVVAVLGLLTSAWPGVAQSEKPLLRPMVENFSGERVHESGPSQRLVTVRSDERFFTGDLSLSTEAFKSSLTHLALPVPAVPTADWTRFVYQSARDGNWEIYSQQGGIESRLTYHSATDTLPRLNRGATKIAFVSNRDGDSEIFTMNASGGNVQQLTFNTSTDTEPNWSPDSSRLAFASYRTGSWEIFVMNADGSGQTQLTYGSGNLKNVMPAWSPDGLQIAWIQIDGSYGSLDLMNPDGSNQYSIAARQLYLEDPIWSPNNGQLAFDFIHSYYPWLKIGMVNRDGSGFGEIPQPGFPLVDFWAGSWSPSGDRIAYTLAEYNQSYELTGLWIEHDVPGQFWGFFYFYRQRITSTGLDAFVDWQPTDIWPPTSHVNSLPVWTNSPDISINWAGTDTGPAGIAAYDLQCRDGAAGDWTDWLLDTQSTSADFPGQSGHTYYFRSRARDYAGNLEAYPGGNGDTSTTVYQHSLTGQILGNRDQPVTVASVAANPAALNTGISRHDGLFDLYFASGGNYTLNISRTSFGTLPSLLNVTVPASSTVPTLYLPPLDDQLSDGHFESGTLSAWNPTGDLPPTITATAHTGNYAVVLGGIVPSATISSGPYLSTIEQTITVPLTLTDGTLSLLYKVDAADPFSDTLTVYLIAAADSLTFTLPVTATDWTHHWFDVSTWTSPTATLRVELATLDAERTVGVSVDEITWGSSIIGSRPIYLPIMRR